MMTQLAPWQIALLCRVLQCAFAMAALAMTLTTLRECAAERRYLRDNGVNGWRGLLSDGAWEQECWRVAKSTILIMDAAYYTYLAVVMGASRQVTWGMAFPMLIALFVMMGTLNARRTQTMARHLLQLQDMTTAAETKADQP
jgi:hypothetical protein